MAITHLPKDSMMLLSFVNTRLRDDAIDINGFCSQFQVTRDWLEETLAALDYKYDEKLNRFL